MLAFGVYRLGLGVDAQQTLAFVLIVFGNQAICYVNRDPRHWWSSRPSVWLLLSSVVDILITMALAVGGIGMTPLPIVLVVATLGAAMAFLIVFDLVKTPILSAGREIIRLTTAQKAPIRA